MMDLDSKCCDQCETILKHTHENEGKKEMRNKQKIKKAPSTYWGKIAQGPI